MIHREEMTQHGGSGGGGDSIYGQRDVIPPYIRLLRPERPRKTKTGDGGGLFLTKKFSA